MQKQVADVSLSTAMMLYDQRIAEQDMQVRRLECDLYAAKVCLDNTRRVRMEFARFIERNDRPKPPNTNSAP
jgi:hypothetical protein